MYQIAERLKPTTILLSDKKTLATIYPIESCKVQLPLDLVEFLCEEFNTEILTSSNNDDITFPFFNALTFSEFEKFWFSGFSGIMMLGDDLDLFNGGQNLEARQWEREFLGTFSLNAKYPARSSHIATGNFLVNIGVRNQGIGTTMLETMLAWAKHFNYKYCMFDNIYGTNQSMIKIMNKHHFRLIGSINNAGILGPLDRYNDDILDNRNKFVPLLIYGKPIMDIMLNATDKLLTRDANELRGKINNRAIYNNSNSIFESNNDVLVDIHIDPNSQPYLSEIQNMKSDVSNTNDKNDLSKSVTITNNFIKNDNNDKENIANNNADMISRNNNNNININDNSSNNETKAKPRSNTTGKINNVQGLQKNESMDESLSKIDSKTEKYPIVVTCTLEDERKIHINFNLMDFLRFKRIRYFLENNQYPEGCNSTMKSRLRASATRYSLQGTKLMFRDKEVIDDPIRMVEIVRSTHIHTDHSGINKVTSLIGEHFHFIGIKNIVVQYLRNCPHCKEIKIKTNSVRKNDKVPQENADQPENLKKEYKSNIVIRDSATFDETYSMNMNQNLKTDSTERNKRFVEMFFDSDSDDPEYHVNTSDSNSSSEVDYENDNNVMLQITSTTSNLYKKNHSFLHLGNTIPDYVNNDMGALYSNADVQNNKHSKHAFGNQMIDQKTNFLHLQLDSDDEDDSDYHNDSEDDASDDDEDDMDLEGEDENSFKNITAQTDLFLNGGYRNSFEKKFKRRKYNVGERNDLNGEEDHADELIRAVYKHR